MSLCSQLLQPTFQMYAYMHVKTKANNVLKLNRKRSKLFNEIRHLVVLQPYRICASLMRFIIFVTRVIRFP